MPKFRFAALTLENTKVTGVVDARDPEDFRKIMRSRDLYPIKFKAIDEKTSSYRIKAAELAEFCRQLSGMLSSGVTILRTMEIFKERDFKPKLRGIYEQMHKDIQQGMALSEAMRRQGMAFPELLINMVASGESGGKLGNVTAGMAVHYEKEHRLDGKIKSASRYPKILGVATIAVVLIVFTFVLPIFFEMLEDFELPLITQIVISISGFMLSRWFVWVAVLLLIVVAVRYLLATYKTRLAFDRAKLRMPFVGKLLKTIYTARFSRTLSSLYSSGVPMIRALEITGTTVINKYIESQLPGLVKDVRNGESLSASVRKIDGFDKKLPNTILVGEESGRLDTMLVSTADSFEYEAEQAASALVQLSEPLMIVAMGLVIIAVLLSVMMPMAAIYEGFGL